MKLKIEIPGKVENNLIEFEHALFILGANGSGKTNLGAFIEKNKNDISLILDDDEVVQNKTIHRITAQKVIQFPLSISVGGKGETSLFNILLNGAEKANDQDHTLQYKYKSLNASEDYDTDIRYRIGSLNDYSILLQYLFTKHTKVTDDDRRNRFFSDKNTDLETCIEIWEKIFNKRKIYKDGFELKASFLDSKIEYTASLLSDGERVAFYLISKVIISPKNSIIIIDEPELHLNKSITHALYNELMDYRNDCIFIFMTHDLDLASSFPYKKLWLREYLGSEKWDFSLLEENVTALPEELLFKVLGSRRNVIFVEGREDSYDSKLYRVLFPKSLIFPVGSCSNVINYVKSLNANINLLNNIKIKGIVDRDRRSDSEIEHLSSENIKTIPYSEVENIFISKSVMELIYKNIPNENMDAVNECIKYITDLFIKQVDTQKKEFIRDRLKYKLNALDISNIEDDLASKVNLLCQEVKLDVDTLFQNSDTLPYEEILKIFNKKSLISEVSKILIGNKDSKKYCYIVIELLKKNEEIKASLLKELNLI